MWKIELKQSKWVSHSLDQSLATEKQLYFHRLTIPLWILKMGTKIASSFYLIYFSQIWGFVAIPGSEAMRSSKTSPWMWHEPCFDGSWTRSESNKTLKNYLHKMEWQEDKENTEVSHARGAFVYEITAVHRGFTVDAHPFTSSVHWNPQRPHWEAMGVGGLGGWVWARARAKLHSLI